MTYKIVCLGSFLWSIKFLGFLYQYAYIKDSFVMPYSSLLFRYLYVQHMKLLEACAIKKELPCCLNLSLSSCEGLVVEHVALAIVRMLNKKDENLSEVSNETSDIFSLSSLIVYVSFSFS